LFHIFHKWLYFDKDDNPIIYLGGNYRDQGIDYKICDKCKAIEHLITYGYCGQGDDGSTIWLSHKEYVWKLAHDEIAHAEKNKVKFKAEIDAVKSPRIPTIPYEECYKVNYYSDYCRDSCVKYSLCWKILIDSGKEPIHRDKHIPKPITNSESVINEYADISG